MNHLAQQSQGNSQERRFICPLTKEVMTDAVRIVTTGKSFQRQALQQWMEKIGKVCPVTGTPFTTDDIETNFSLQWEILFWQRQQAEHQPIVCEMPSSYKMSPRNSITKSIDSPPTLPERRGSGDSFSTSLEAPMMEQNNRRFLSCCPSGVSSCCSNSSLCMKPPRRCASFDSLDLFQPEDDDGDLFTDGDDLQSGTSFSRLVSILDEALKIIADV
jgi:U-box domain